jgi:hypothetical protein
MLVALAIAVVAVHVNIERSGRGSERLHGILLFALVACSVLAGITLLAIISFAFDTLQIGGV